MRYPIPGTPAGYNARLSDFCRAADMGILLTMGRGSTLTFTDNTIYSASRTGIEIECDGSAGGCDRTSLIDFRGNVFIGFQNNDAAGYPGRTSGEYSNPIYLDEHISANPFTNSGSTVSGNTIFFPGGIGPAPDKMKRSPAAPIRTWSTRRGIHSGTETWSVRGGTKPDL